MSHGFQFENNVVTALALPITGMDTELTVITGTGDDFPEPDYDYEGGDWFALTLRDPTTNAREICYCTGRSTDVLTVLRGREGTAQIAFDAGAEVSMQITAGILEFLRDL